MHIPDSPGVVNGRYVDEDTSNGIDGAEVDAAMMNALAYEAINLIRAAGITLVKGNETQLLQAVQSLLGYDFGFRNALINGGFLVWERGQSHALTTAGGGRYTADRWFADPGGPSGATIVSLGNVDVALGEIADHTSQILRWEQTAAATSTEPFLEQRIERMPLYAGKKFTVSFWARVISGTINLVPYLRINHGVGGSAEVTIDGPTQGVTATFQRFNVTFDVPSLVGKTIGAFPYLAVGLRHPLSQSYELQLGNSQAEPSDVPTRFENRPIPIEEALCMRYYENSWVGAPGTAGSLEGAAVFVEDGADFVADLADTKFKVPKRVSPSVTFYSPTTGAAGKIAWPSNTDRDVVDVVRRSLQSTGAPQLASVPNSATKGFAHWAADAEIY